MSSGVRDRDSAQMAPQRGRVIRSSARRIRAASVLLWTLVVAVCASVVRGQGGEPVFHVNSEIHPTYSVFHDPDGNVSVKEFAFFHNFVSHLDTLVTPDSISVTLRSRQLFHFIYQRSGGTHIAETSFGHAWSPDLLHWAVDTLAFAVDTTWWNRHHVWSPSVIEANGRTYLFYTGVDEHEDQRIGYASTALFDTSNTVWDPPRVMVWEAASTGWAVPDPPIYSGQTQFRDAYVMHDPEQAGCLLMYFGAHDSVDTKLGRGGLVVGVARSDPGSVDIWHDLGYFPKTLRGVTNVTQLEGPHAFSVDGTGAGWRLMFSNAGAPPGENGGTTIRFIALAPGESPADTTPAHWSAPMILRNYLNGLPTATGWSGSEELHVSGADYLGGFTAWSVGATGIAFTRVIWNGNDFTLAAPSVTSVDEYRSPARGLTLSLVGWNPRVGHVRFEIDAPLALAAKLEVFDAQGRRIATPFEGELAVGRTQATWDLTSRDGLAVASGVYFGQLRFAGGVRTVRIVVTR